MLRKARNSKVLNVVSMTNLKTFDRHVQRCLTVSNDEVFHKMERRRAGKEAGLCHPSILTNSTPGLSHSVMSNLDGDIAKG